MSKETTGKPARMSIPGRSVDDTNQPPQTIMAGSENDENLKTLDEELQEKLGKIFNSKPVWNQIRKQLEDKGEIPSPDIQNVDSIEALFRVLKEHNKIKPWDYAFLQYILVRFKDDKTETRKLISDYTAKIPSETEETKPKKTGNHKKQGKPKRPKRQRRKSIAPSKTKRKMPVNDPDQGQSSGPSKTKRQRAGNDPNQGQSSGSSETEENGTDNDSDQGQSSGQRDKRRKTSHSDQQ